MKSVMFARLATALLLAPIALSVTGCGNRPYKTTENQFAGRPVPPSQLTQRVLVGISIGAAQGAAQVLDAKRDIRSNVYQPNSIFAISGFSSNAQRIISYPEQTRGYVFNADGSVVTINYSTESALGNTAPVSGLPSDVAVPSDVQAVYAAQERDGLFTINAPSSGSGTTASLGVTYAFAVPGVYRVAVNPAHTVVLMMVRNSNLLYRLLQINSNQTAPAGALTCQPLNKPVYCIVPVGSSQPDGNIRDPALHRPTTVYFSPDGSQAYILSCGRECGGSAATGDDTSAVSFADLSGLRIDNYPTSSVYTSPIVNTTLVPGGATAAISDGATLYIAGQSLQTDNIFGGNLSLISLATRAVTNTYSISDGTHTRMLFADDNTLWIGSSNCASGERAAHGQNYNCLTRFSITSKSAAIVPAVTPGGAVTVSFPNGNLDPYYYGSLTGICWVEGLNKVYTAYGGQVHAFKTVDGSEIDNSLITVQGTATDVAYIDASTNVAN